MAGVFANGCAFAKAIFGCCEHRLRFRFSNQHRNDALSIVQTHAANAAGCSAHGSDVVFIEAHGLCRIGKKHHIMGAIGDSRTDEKISVVQIDRNDAGLSGVGKIG